MTDTAPEIGVVGLGGMGTNHAGWLTDAGAELAGAPTTVEERFVELQTALGRLATEDEAYAQYHARRLADLVYDVVAGALLLILSDTSS
ncbi:MAG: hypothetical protein V5A28_08365 [Haloarculaceae archaeon]